MKRIIQFIIQLLMRTIKTVGVQYIESDEAPVAGPPDLQRLAILLNTTTGYEYRWNITDQAWVAVPKVYRARLTQSGNDVPVATILENTLGVTITWSRNSEGFYIGNLSATISTKGFTMIGPVDFDHSGVAVAQATYLSGNVVGITTKTLDESPLLTDGLLVNTAFQLLVYP